jgi:hypothetical protein
MRAYDERRRADRSADRTVVGESYVDSLVRVLAEQVRASPHMSDRGCLQTVLNRLFDSDFQFIEHRGRWMV